eukprot:CAMPEP_0115156656 /NCGR_PEP_ID=MMETSP0227-20121206/68578_1 /TAXON_ID=89957 /ORGANISM="Polarella glacialis, Strain CCMP 1383" /LENGTH=133 /DNA_ID=CAMNT_0002567881 /DNA_START=74 /DNA_END=476 /DNA_ORIENTATION=+
MGQGASLDPPPLPHPESARCPSPDELLLGSCAALALQERDHDLAAGSQHCLSAAEEAAQQLPVQVDLEARRMLWELEDDSVERPAVLRWQGGWQICGVHTMGCQSSSRMKSVARLGAAQEAPSVLFRRLISRG